ncbi:MAG: response regulator, partial [Flavobacterium sp.]
MNFNSSINTGNEGFYWLNKIKELKSDAAVIMITAYGDIDLAIRSLKEGAFDFVVKPWHNEKLINTIVQASKNKNINSASLKLQTQKAIIGSELIGESEVMQNLFYKIQKIAPTDANILVLGENGTGKDLIAKAIHQQSLRANNAYIKVDVG